MTGLLLILSAISLALLLAATIFLMPSASPVREAVATVLALPLAGVIAVLVGDIAPDAMTFGHMAFSHKKARRLSPPGSEEAAIRRQRLCQAPRSQ